MEILEPGYELEAQITPPHGVHHPANNQGQTATANERKPRLNLPLFTILAPALSIWRKVGN